MRKLLALVLTIFMTLAVGYAASPKRTSKTVRQERAATTKKIDKTKRQIKTNIEDTRRELNRLTLLQGQIDEQNRRIAAMKRSADSISRVSKLLADSVTATEARVETLRDSYGSALRTIRRQRQTTSTTAFIFSSASVSEAYRRIRYLRELGKWQTEKARALRAEAAKLEESKARLDSARARLEATIGSLESERKELQENLTVASDLVASLKRQTDNLNKVLAQQQEQARRLNDELNRVIEEEMRKAAEEEAARKADEEARLKQLAQQKEAEQKAEADKQKNDKKKDKKKDKKSPAKSPQPEKPAEKPVQQSAKPKTEPAPKPIGNFADQKGKLPSPVDVAATVTGTFGRHTHSELSKVELINNGIDFETTTGASARAVFPGVVSMIIVMDGYHNVVLVRHGEYLTVYAGIEELAVRKGQEVEAGQTLGKLYSDPNDGYRTRLHFEVRHEKEKLNPADWLR